MAIAERAGFAIIHAIMRTMSVLAVLSIIGLIGYSLYVTVWKPHHNPTKTTSQVAEKIENTDIKETHNYGIFHFKLGPISFGL